MDMLFITTQSTTLLQILKQDQAGEVKGADLKEHIESLSVYYRDYFSVAYKQHQNGPAESLINSIMFLNRTQMVESG